MRHSDCRVTASHGEIENFAGTLPRDLLITHQLGCERVRRILSCFGSVCGRFSSDAHRGAVLGELQAGNCVGIIAKHKLFVIVRDVLRGKSCFFTVACSESCVALNMINLFGKVGAIVPFVGVSLAVGVFVLIVSLERTDVPNVGACVD